MVENAFAEKYDKYGKMLFRLAYVHLGNSADSEDVMQEAFYRLLFCAPDFMDAEHEKRWLIRIAVNLCKDRLKSGWRRVHLLDEIPPNPKNQEDSEIAGMLLSLPEKYRAVIHLHYYEGYGVAEIGKMLGITQSAVKMRLARGREMIKLELEM